MQQGRHDALYAIIWLWPEERAPESSMTPVVDAFRWNHDGLLLDLGFYAVRWYSLMWLGGFLIGWQMFQGFCRRERRSTDQLDTLLPVTLAGALIGARLGHVLFYHLDYFLQHPLEIFLVWRGGLASHGGTIGILVAVWLWSRRKPDFGYLWTLDRIAVPTALAGAMIRIGNFFNSEILGRPSDLPWAVIFERAGRLPRRWQAPPRSCEPQMRFPRECACHRLLKMPRRTPDPIDQMH